MQSPKYLRIRNAVVHLVNPQQSNGYQLSQRELPLRDNADVADFLKAQLVRVHRDQSARPARFERRGRGTICQAVRQVARNRRKFLAASTKIAERLHGILKKDKRISGAALAICVYTAREDREAEHFLGVLKLDPSWVFRPVVHSDPSGKSYVTLRPVTNVLLAAGERTQKGASIRLAKTGENESELQIVDHQRSRSDEPALFFTDGFLGAALVVDERMLTKRFFKSVVRASNSIHSHLSSQQAAKLRTSLDAAMASNKVDIEDWIKRLPLSAAAKGTVAEEIGAEIDRGSINVDKSTAAELTRLRTFCGDRGFRLTVEAARYDSVFAEPPRIVEDPKQGSVTELVLLIRHLREVM